MPRDREQGLRVARAGAERFGLEADSLRLIHDAPEGDGFVYEGTREGTATILKVGVADEQGLPAARAKAEFVAYLGNRGGQVATPYRSADGRLVETVRDGDSLLTLTAYRKAPGRPLNSADPRQCTHEVLAQWGRVLGRFHALAQEYEFGHRPCPAGEPLPRMPPAPSRTGARSTPFSPPGRSTKASTSAGRPSASDSPRCPNRGTALA